MRSKGLFVCCLFVFNSLKHEEWHSCLTTSSLGTTVILKFLSNATHSSCHGLDLWWLEAKGVLSRYPYF